MATAADFAQLRAELRALIKAGAIRAAEARCKDPTLPTAIQGAFLNEVASACSATHDHARAVLLFTEALAKLPHPATLRNLCEALSLSGNIDEAITRLQAYLANNPQDRITQEKYLRLTLSAGRLDLAELTVAHLQRETPNDISLLHHLAYILDRTERESEARHIWGHLKTRDLDNPIAKVRHVLSLSSVMQSAIAVASERQTQLLGLQGLSRALQECQTHETVLAQALNASNFYSAYHGEDDVAVQTRYANIITSFLAKDDSGSPKPEWKRKRPKIGFISAFWHNHTVGRYFASWVTELDRQQFDVSVFHNGKRRDELTALLSQKSDYQHFDDETKLSSAILASSPDVLIYPDVGMTARNLPLLANRLAAVQCAAWGHPVTTGFSNLDAYFSCTEMEPENAQTHYVEKLRLLPGIGTCYAPPKSPTKLARAALGLPTEKTLLLCPQSPHKIHPDNHAPWAEILRRLPDAQWVMFSSKYGHHTAELNAVLKDFDPILIERLIVLPQTSHERFLQVNLACDLMLDTLRWSGGNTSLDAIQCNLPIVSLPGRFMRGRQTLGMYKLMGLEDEISTSVEQYVEKAVYLAKTPTAREQLSAQIAANKHKLFNDLTPIRALERHLFELLAQKGLKFESAAHPDAATLQA